MSVFGLIWARIAGFFTRTRVIEIRISSQEAAQGCQATVCMPDGSSAAVRLPPCTGGAQYALKDVSPNSPPAWRERVVIRVAIFDIQPSINRHSTQRLEQLRHQLLAKLMHDESTCNRLIDAERERTPTATDEELLQAAIERWERDNR